MPRLQAELQTQPNELMEIKQRHVDDLEACAKAMMYGRGKADRERDRKAAGLEERAKGARAQDSSETSDSESEEQRATQKKEELNTEHSAEVEHVVTPKTTQTQTCPETAHYSRCRGRG